MSMFEKMYAQEKAKLILKRIVMVGVIIGVVLWLIN